MWPMREPASRSALLTWRRVSWLAVAVLAPTFLNGDPAPPASAPSLRLSPETLQMGAFYSGATVRIEGEVPPGTTPLVVIRGPEETEFFDRKGRVGPVWLGVGRVHVTRVPALFVRLGGGDLRSLLDEAAVEAYQLDEAAITRRMSIRKGCQCPPGETKPTERGAVPPCTTGTALDGREAELVRASYFALKTKEGTYQVRPDAVATTESSGTARYRTQLEWPRRARAGSYQVEVLASRGRSVVGQASAAFQVTKVGLPARLGKLAKSHSMAYGLAAVLAAAITGFAMDSLTRRRWALRAGRGRSSPPPPPPTASESTKHVSQVKREEDDLVGTKRKR